jgi:hypothetical protein
MLNLVHSLLQDGREVDLVVCRLQGAYVQSVPEAAKPVVLESAGQLPGRLAALMANLRWPGAVLRAVVLPSKTAPEVEYLGSLKQYLRERRPVSFCQL